MSCISAKNEISFTGSACIIAQYLDFCLNTILYQRGVYPPHEFSSVNKYDMPLLKSTNYSVTSYLQSTLADVQQFLAHNDIDQVTMAISDARTKEVLEYWDFNVANETLKRGGTSKSEKKYSTIQAEIRAVLKQITSCGTFMPLLEEHKCTFSIQVRPVRHDMVWPPNWVPVTRVKLEDASILNFRMFSTGAHSVGSQVTYKNR